MAVPRRPVPPEDAFYVSYGQVDSGALGIAALVAGEVQFFDADPFQAVQLQSQGKQILFIYNLTKRVTLDMVMHPEVARAKNVSRSTPIAYRSRVQRAFRGGRPQGPPQGGGRPS